MLQRGIAALLTLLLLMGSAYALSIPAKPTNYINDYASLLSPDTVQNLDQQLQQFEKQTTNQIVVAIFPSLENQSLEDFTTRLEDQWKIGREGKDNGILLVIFLREYQVRIEVGYGLESVVTDALAGQIIEGSIVPNFKTKNYDAGVSEAVGILMKVTQHANVRAATKLAPDHTVYYTLGAILFLAAFIFFIRAFRRDKQVAKLVPQHPVVQPTEIESKNAVQKAQKFWFIYYIVMLLTALLGRGGGGGGGRGGNDFRGGGGGRSGGGGASGQW
jgi:uncharacterized protein